jgi:2,4-dienoyl-CoA reductase-like NADH-dependent reductase (Old Yellow Enzyme family)
MITNLFSPFRLKGLTLPNRFIMPAMQLGGCSDGRLPAETIEHYRIRVVSGVPLVIAESSAIDHPSSSGTAGAAYIDETTVPVWTQCANSVHSAGGRFLIQLWHEGAMRSERSGRYPDAPSLSPSGLLRSGVRNGRDATTAEVGDLVAAYARSAIAAQRAGADGVEIHAAHGFLIDQFLWAETNHRTDQLRRATH